MAQSLQQPVFISFLANNDSFLLPLCSICPFNLLLSFLFSSVHDALSRASMPLRAALCVCFDRVAALNGAQTKQCYRSRHRLERKVFKEQASLASNISLSIRRRVQ